MTCQYMRRWPPCSRSLVMQSNTLCGVRREEMEKRPKLITFAERLTLSYFPLVRCPSALRSLKDAAALSVSSQFYALTEERLLSALYRPYFALSEKRCWKLLFFIYIEQAEFIFSLLERRGLCAMCFDGAARSSRRWGDDAWNIHWEMNSIFACCDANKKKKDNLLAG